MWTTKSIFTCPIFYLTFTHVGQHAFLWTAKFQSGKVNPKSYLPSLATEVSACGRVWVCLQDSNLPGQSDTAMKVSQWLTHAQKIRGISVL